MYAADVDGDGDVDVLSASLRRGQNRLVREHRWQGEFWPAAGGHQSGILEHGSVYAADLDGDGDMDVLSASRPRPQNRLVREHRWQGEFHTQQA